MPTRHSVFGGSNASMWLNCAGGVALRTQVPRRPTGMAAQHGSACHEVMEQLLLDPDKHPAQFLGATVLGVVLEQHHIMAIELALEEFNRIEETFGDDVQIWSEKEVGLSDEAFGTMDAGLLEGTRAALIDFKFGQQEVVADSDQGKVYGVYARASIPGFDKATNVELYIIQPALDPATDRLDISGADLDTFRETIQTAIRMAKQPAAEFREGDWCKWCDAKLVCPSKVQRLDTLTAPNHILDLADLGQQLIKIKGWEKWAEEAMERLQHEIEHGAKGTGWKLVAKRGTRQWNDEPATVAAFREANVPADKYLVTKLVSPAQAEKLIPKKVVNRLATSISSGNTIAPVDDKRPEVLLSPELLGNILKKMA